MLTSFPLIVSMLFGAGDAPKVQSVCKQALVGAVPGRFERTPGRSQAVVLIHGYFFHLQDRTVAQPEFRPWMKVDGPLVKELAKNADVFLFAYGQNASIDTIVKESKLGENIARIKELGYREIVLVGHSAGGLIARHFVEDNPSCGVTRVVQVCAPNAGSPLATFKSPKTQQPFVDSLSEAGRKQILKDRAAKVIPTRIEFVCVVARLEAGSDTDGVVPCGSQWTDDLRRQGIPAVGMVCSHRGVVRDVKMAETVSRVIRTSQPRWTAQRVQQGVKEILGK